MAEVVIRLFFSMLYVVTSPLKTTPSGFVFVHNVSSVKNLCSAAVEVEDSN